MFTKDELRAIAAICDSEIAFLDHASSRGLRAVQGIALAAAIRAKATNLADGLEKMEATKEASKE